MQSSKRATVLSVVAFFLLVLLGVWWYFGFSIDFMRFFAAELTPTPTPTATPVISPQVSCSPATQTVAIGQSAQLSAQGGIGDYSWFAPGGTLAVNTSNQGATGVTYATKGIKKVTVQRARMVGGVASQYVDSVACTVIVQ